MQCEDVREQFAEYVNDRIEESIRLQIDEHLNACRACGLELDELRSLWMELGNIPQAEPTPAVRARFDELLRSRRDLPESTPPRLRRGAFRRRHIWQIGIAAASLVLGIIVGHHIRPAVGPNTELAELRRELYQTRQMVALSLMQQQAATDRLKGISWSYQLQQPSSELLRALLDTLMHDPSVNVRLATIDALRQFGDEPVVRRDWLRQ